MKNKRVIVGYYVTYRNAGTGRLERLWSELRARLLHLVRNGEHVEVISTMPSRLNELPTVIHGFRKGALREIFN